MLLSLIYYYSDGNIVNKIFEYNDDGQLNTFIYDKHGTRLHDIPKGRNKYVSSCLISNKRIYPNLVVGIGYKAKEVYIYMRDEFENTWYKFYADDKPTPSCIQCLQFTWLVNNSIDLLCILAINKYINKMSWMLTEYSAAIPLDLVKMIAEFC